MLAAALDAEAHYDDELRDLLHELTDQHEKCTAARLAQGLQLREGSSIDPSVGSTNEEALHRDSAINHGGQVPDLSDVRTRLSDILQRLTRPPEQSAPLPVLSERIRDEVNRAVLPNHGIEAARRRLLKFFSQRCEGLHMKCSMIASRLKRHVRSWASAERVGPGIQERLCLLQREIRAAESRIIRLQPTVAINPEKVPLAKATTGTHLFGGKNAAYRGSTLCCIFKSDIAVFLREHIFTDRATRGLRQFLCRMQHLPISHRSTVWQTSVQLHTSVQACAGGTAAEGGGSSPLPMKWLPMTLRLEQHLHNLAAEVRCRSSLLRTDKGHSFARVVASEFPVLLQREHSRMRLEPFPVKNNSVESVGQQQHASTIDGQGSPHDSTCEGPPTVGSISDGPFLKKDEWLPYVLLHPKVDLIVAEQRVLMTDECSTLQMHRHGPQLKRTTSTLDVDGQLIKELELLKETDVQAVQKQLSELAHERSGVGKPSPPQKVFLTSKEDNTNEAQAPEHVLRSYFLLRHVKMCQLRCELLGLLNLYRFAQQRLAHGTLASQLSGEVSTPASRASESSGRQAGSDTHEWKSSPPTLAPGGCGGHPGTMDCSVEEALTLMSNTERLEVLMDSQVRVVDGHGLQIVHDSALNDLNMLENEMLRISGHVIRQTPPDLRPAVDPAGVLAEVLHAEVAFHRAKWQLLEPYLEVYEHTVNPSMQQRVAQRIVDVMAYRPLFDLDARSKMGAYAAAAAALQERAYLLKRILCHQLGVERAVAARLARHSEMIPPTGKEVPRAARHGRHVPSYEQNDDPQLSMVDGLAHEQEGLPLPLGTSGFSIRMVPTGEECIAVDLLDFSASAVLTIQVDELVEQAAMQIANELSPEIWRRQAIERACAMTLAEEWEDQIHNGAVDSLAMPRAMGGGDLLGAENLDDPAWLMLLMEDVAKNFQVPDDSSKPQSRIESGSRPHDLSESHGSRAALNSEGSRRAHSTKPSLPPSPDPKSVGLEVLGKLRSASSSRQQNRKDSRRPSLAMGMEEGVSPGRKMNSELELPAFPEFVGLPVDEVLIALLCYLMEHVVVRSHLADTAHEVQALGTALSHQGQLVGTTISLRSEPLQEFADLMSTFGGGVSANCPNKEEVSKGRAVRLSASEFEPSFGDIDFSSGDQIIAYCSVAGLRELRHALQHEVAVRWLYATCAMHNALVLDMVVRRSGFVEAAKNLGSSETDPAALLLQDLRRVSELCIDGPLWVTSNLSTSTATANKEETAPNRSELSRLATACTWPSMAKPPVWLGVSSSCREKASIFRKKVASVSNPSEAWRRLQRFRQRFLAHASILVAERACEVAVRVQAAKTVHELRTLLAMLPAEVSPIRVSSGEQPWQFFDAEGGVVSPLVVPTVLEALALQGVNSRPLNISSEIRRQEETLPDACEISFSEDKQASQDAAPKLELDYGGNAFFVLQLMSQLGSVVALSLFSASLAGDRCLLLRLHHATENAGHDFSAARQAAAAVLDIGLLGKIQMDDYERVRPPLTPEQSTWDAIQSVRLDLMTLTSQLQSLRASESSPLTVLALLQRRRLCSQLRTAVLLAEAKHQTLGRGDSDAAAEISRWALYLQGYPAEGGALVTVPRAGPCEDCEDGQAQSPSATPWNNSQMVLPQHPICLREQEQEAEETDQKEREAISTMLASWLPDPMTQPVDRALLNFFLASRLAGALHHVTASGIGGSLLPSCGCRSWDLPSFPLRLVTRALCMLPTSQRTLAADQQIRLDMRSDAYLQIKGTHPDKADSLLEELEFCQTCFASNHLRTLALCLQLRRLPPQTPAEHMFFEAAFATQSDLQPKTVEAAEETGEAESKTDRSADEELRFSVRREMREAFDVIGCLVVSISKSITRVGVSLLEQLTMQLAARVEDEGGQAVVRFVGKLRGRGILLETFGQSGSTGWVFKEHDLDECVNELGHKLLQWACRASDEQLSAGSHSLAASLSQTQEAEQLLLQARLDGAWDAAELQARLISTVADRGWRQLLEIDRMYRVLSRMAAAAIEMEHRLNTQVHQIVLHELSELDTELAQARQRLKGYNKAMVDAVQKEYEALRHEIMEQVKTMGATNFILQQKAKAMHEEAVRLASGLEEQPQAPVKLQQPIQVISASGRQEPEFPIVEYHRVIHELEMVTAKMQTHYRLRFQDTRQALDLEAQKLAADLSSNEALWENTSREHERQRAVDEELSSAKQRHGAALATIDQMNMRDADHARACTQLEDWKEKAWRLQAKLEGEIHKFKRDDQLNVRKMESDVASLDTKLMQKSNAAPAEERQLMQQDSIEKERVAMRRQLKKEEKISKKGALKASVMTLELERGHEDEEESIVRLVFDDYQDVAKRIAVLEAENQRLREFLNKDTGGLKGLVASGAKRLQLYASPPMPEGNSFEENLCYSVGFLKTPRLWGVHHAIDQAHGVYVPNESFRGEAETPRMPARGSSLPPPAQQSSSREGTPRLSRSAMHSRSPRTTGETPVNSPTDTTGGLPVMPGAATRDAAAPGRRSVRGTLSAFSQSYDSRTPMGVSWRPPSGPALRHTVEGLLPPPMPHTGRTENVQPRAEVRSVPSDRQQQRRRVSSQPTASGTAGVHQAMQMLSPVSSFGTLPQQP